ncbi:unnamed protein product [Urochloa humidicola]
MIPLTDLIFLRCGGGILVLGEQRVRLSLHSTHSMKALIDSNSAEHTHMIMRKGLILLRNCHVGCFIKESMLSTLSCKDRPEIGQSTGTKPCGSCRCWPPALTRMAYWASSCFRTARRWREDRGVGGEIVCGSRNGMTGMGARRRKWDGGCDGEATTTAMAGGNSDGGLRGNVMAAPLLMERRGF